MGKSDVSKVSVVESVEMQTIPVSDTLLNQLREHDVKKILDALPQDGTSTTNERLRSKLRWTVRGITTSAMPSVNRAELRQNKDDWDGLILGYEPECPSASLCQRSKPFEIG